MGELRIIAGEHRGRKLKVPKGVRPTGDRTREMLFNWLQMEIVGTRCCDLFAGTGALGLEAKSRGASAVDFVEILAPTANMLKSVINDWKIENATVHNMSAETFVRSADAYDIYFVDAPFDMPVDDILQNLNAKIIYVETASKTAVQVPENYRIDREKILGDVKALLLRRV